jgi:tRNA pseudouridine38-40 synthase
MFRYKITVEYDGSFFCGWQSQKSDAETLAETFQASPKNQDKPSVQGVLTHSIQKMTGLHVLVEGAGRTDAGVHSLGQVAHFDLPTCVAAEKIQAALNFYSQEWGVVVLQAEQVPQNFHARFSAVSREYFYRIVQRRAPLVLEKNRAWHVPEALSFKKMEESAAFLEGFHDFQSFRSAHCQGKDSHKTLTHCQVFEREDGVFFRLKARSFLHNQVRIIVGTLIEIGKGKMDLPHLLTLLEKPDRTQAGPTAPAHGLYFAKVEYDSYIPSHSEHVCLEV